MCMMWSFIGRKLGLYIGKMRHLEHCEVGYDDYEACRVHHDFIVSIELV